jgi:hypothetical protein
MVDKRPRLTDPDDAAHTIAFTTSTLIIEKVIRKRWADEVVQIVAEDNDKVRVRIKDVHQMLRNPTKVSGGPIIPNDLLPLRKIRNSVHFASKQESYPLQLADICAFTIRGHLSGHPHNPPLYKKIKPMIMLLKEEELYRGPHVTASPPYESTVTWVRF